MLAFIAHRSSNKIMEEKDSLMNLTMPKSTAHKSSNSDI